MRNLDFLFHHTEEVVVQRDVCVETNTFACRPLSTESLCAVSVAYSLHCHHDSMDHALCIQRILCFVCARAQCVSAQCMSAQCMNARCPLAQGGRVGRAGETSFFLLKWLRYRPEHDVKLLISVVGRASCG